jgi:RNA polymerase sigma-70 factor, ECF subfamily
METSLSWLGRLVDCPSGADWQRLNQDYVPLLMVWTTRAGVPPGDADDVVQETMLVVVRRVSEFQHLRSGAFRGWLRVILSNHLKQYFRKHKALICGYNLDDMADSNSQISIQIDREHDEHIARQAMNRVEKDFEESTWAAFHRQVVDGLKPGDVAKELKMSVNAVIKAKSRVLKRIREELGAMSHDQ